MAVQNYEVKVGMLGGYPAGSVLPRYVLEAAAGNADAAKRARVVAEMVERGTVVPTDAPVNVALAPPVPLGAAAENPVEQVVADRNALRESLTAMTADRDAQRGRAELAETRRAAIAAEIAEYVETNSHFRGVCEDHQTARDALETRAEALAARVSELTAENAKLRADVEALTAPPKKSLKQTAAA